MFQESKPQDTHILNGDSCRTNYDVVDELGAAVIDKNYDAVKNVISNHNIDPNSEIIFHGRMYMTALEFSVYSGDWKMTLLLFLNGADPSYNCFDGTIQSNISYTTSFHHAFKNRVSIPGFEGIQALSGNSDVMNACLWLMEFTDGSFTVNSNVDAVKVLSNLSILLKDLEQGNKNDQELILKGNEYIENCYRSLMSRVEHLSDNTVLNNELFEIVLFSLRTIVSQLINL